METLADYLRALVQRQGMTLRHASMKANLPPEAISQLIRRQGTYKPKPETLRMIAEALDGDLNHMMVLAGHLPEPPPGPLDLDQFSPAISTKIDAIIHKWQQLTLLDPDGANDLIAVVEMQAQLALALARKHKPEVTEEPA